MERFRVCQRKGCEKDSAWNAIFIFRNKPDATEAHICKVGSTITLCDEHRHHFQCRDLITQQQFDRINELAFKDLGRPEAIAELTTMELQPMGNPEWN